MKTHKFLIITLCIACFSLSTIAQNVQKQIDKIVNTGAKYKNAHIAISVKDVTTDSIIVAVNDQKNMIPASITKLYTTSTALEVLGNNFTFKTVIGIQGTVNKGVLRGNLIIKGGGDPTLGSKHFPVNKNFLDSIVSAVKKQGINKIEGKIILDCSLFDKESVPKSWMIGDLGKEFATVVFPIAINDNVFRMSLRSGNPGEPTSINVVDPPQAAQFVSNEVISSDTIKKTSGIVVDPESLTRVSSGNIPANKSSYLISGAMSSPPDVFGLEIRQALYRAAIVEFDQEYLIKNINCIDESVDTILVITSPPLHRIINIINYYSNNHFTEHLVKYLGYAKSGTGSFEEGVKVVSDHVNLISGNINTLNLFDGSGLSRQNTTSTYEMTCFLTQKYKAENTSSSFYLSLPSSGRSGTLRDYGFPPQLIGKIQGKTGSMGGVRNLAGYLTTKSGKVVSFCIMINGYNERYGDMKDAIIEIVDSVYANY